LLAHHGPQSKAIVWAHNTHIGDARFTDMADDGMVNLGQLARERHGEQNVVLIGFGSYQGTVIAGGYWGATPEVMQVPPGRPDSWEEVLHHAGATDCLLIFPPDTKEETELSGWRGHRAIGVVYRPQFEQYGNYVPTVLPRLYDAFLFLDQTQALEPLSSAEAVDEEEVPETYPTGV